MNFHVSESIFAYPEEGVRRTYEYVFPNMASRSDLGHKEGSTNVTVADLGIFIP